MRKDRTGDVVTPGRQFFRMSPPKQVVITSYSIHYTKLYEIGVTLLGLVADRYGVPTAVHLINFLPVIGALFAAMLPLPWQAGVPRTT